MDLFFLIGKAVILSALAKSLPDTCAGIINGSSIGAGNPIASMARTAGVMTVGAISAGAGYAVGAAKATNAAHTIAKENGAEGVVGTAVGMMKAGWQARSDAKVGQIEKDLASQPNSVKNQLLAQANAIKAMHLLDDAPVEQAAPTSTSSTAPMPTSSQAVPAVNTADDSNSGAPTSASTTAVPSQTSAPDHSVGSSGTAAPATSVSGDTPPSQTANPGGSGQDVPPKPSKDDYVPRPQLRGTIDMTTFDPSTLKK